MERINIGLLNNEKKAPDYSDEKMFELLTKSEIHHRHKINKPPVIMSIRQFDKDIPIMTLGNFSMFQGRQKSKKSFATTFISAAAATNQAIQLKFIPSMKGKGVVVVDTEQSDFHVYRNINTVVNLTNYGEQSEGYRVYAMRRFDTKMRLKLTEYLIYNTPNLGLLIIDGIRDLVNDINSQEEAKMITDKLLKWTKEANIHIIVILHENKEGGNARGHLGTEISNKAETILKVQKNQHQPEISVISSENTRGEEFDDIPFRIDYNDNGLYPIICELETIEQKF